MNALSQSQVTPSRVVRGNGRDRLAGDNVAGHVLIVLDVLDDSGSIRARDQHTLQVVELTPENWTWPTLVTGR